MIGKLKGLVDEKNAPELLIDCNGVCYEVQMPLTSFYQLPEVGQQTVVYIHFVVREDAQLLYGFANKTERLLFRQLIKTNGVGPKMALTVLSGMSAEQFVRCVINEDSTTLVKLPGVGKKTAERLIVELRDRLKDWGVEAVPQAGGQVIDNVFEMPTSAFDDAVSALIALGYTSVQANKAIKKVHKEDMGSEALIKGALRLML
ncbi:MAG: Holliday junction branch migration protein RuvA [Psychrosphaera sp.]|nr:Holliday junction branch migration protein RuvA [Psychrosphaera sp.]